MTVRKLYKGDKFEADNKHVSGMTIEVLSVDSFKEVVIDWNDKLLVRPHSQICEIINTFDYEKVN